MKNKKGDITIVLLVFLIVFIVGVTLFTFIREPSKSATIVQSSNLFGSAYFSEQKIEFYIREAGEQALVKSSGDQKDFSNNFKSAMSAYKFDDAILKDFQQKIARGEFNISMMNGNYEISVNDFPIREQDGGVMVIYRPKILVEIIPEEAGVR